MQNPGLLQTTLVTGPRLGVCPQGPVPESATAEQKFRLRASLDVLRTEATLRDLLRALTPAGVDFAVLKGAHLGATVYGKPEDRPHSDVDILVPPEAFHIACNAMVTSGFERIRKPSNRAATEQEFYCWTYYSRHKVPVDVHRALAGHGRYPVDVGVLLARAEGFVYGKTKVRGLAAEDLLLHLCIHMAKSYFSHIRTKHVHDFATLLAKRPIKWEAFIERATRARCRCAAYYALRTAAELGGAAVPAGVLYALRPSWWRRRLIERWIDPGRWPICPLAQKEGGALQVRLGLPLLDRPVDWPAVVVRVVRCRLEDWVRA
jgi:hypothetical protein